MRTVEREIVTALLFSKDGKLLQALQDPNGGGVYPGCWGIIGGGVDEGEGHREALDREVMEEAGIDISKYPMEFVSDGTGEAEKTLKETGERVLAKMKFYRYKIIMDDKNADEIPVTLNYEHTEYHWTDPSELKTMKLTPPSIEVFKQLGYL
jgi:8-oxo-dGTP pyrophosphatase MutT (NUDIX family)